MPAHEVGQVATGRNTLIWLRILERTLLSNIRKVLHAHWNTLAVEPQTGSVMSGQHKEGTSPTQMPPACLGGILGR